MQLIFRGQTTICPLLIIFNNPENPHDQLDNNIISVFRVKKHLEYWVSDNTIFDQGNKIKN